MLNDMKTAALEPMGNTPTSREKALLAEVHVTTAEERRAVVEDIPMGADAFVRAHVEKVVKDNSAERLTRLLPGMPDEQTAMLMATEWMAQKTCLLKRGLDIDVSKGACSRVNQVRLGMLEHVLEHSAAVNEGPFFSDECQSDRINLRPHQRVQAGPSTGAGGLELASTQNDGCWPHAAAPPECAGKLWRTFPGRSGTSADRTPAASMIEVLRKALRCLANEGGLLAARQETATSAGLVLWVQGERHAEEALPPPPIRVLEGHHSGGLSPRLLRGKLGKLVNFATFTRFRGALDNLAEAGKRPEAGGPFWGIKTCGFALARHRSMTRRRPVGPIV